MADGPLLGPEVLGRLARLQLSTRRRLAGRFGGEHRSTRYGASLDFADLRPYHPGDDFRRIDYHAWARLDQLLVRLYEAEDDLSVRLLVDTSASMGGAVLDQGVRCAAALGFVALTRRDVVTLHTFPGGGVPPRFRGPGAAPRLFRALGDLAAAGGTDVVAAARHLLARPGPAGLTVLVSDLLTPDWEEAITSLPARGGDLVVVHVLGADVLEPALTGDWDLVDRESGEVVAVSLTEAARRDAGTLARRWADTVATRCRQVGAGYVRVLDTDDVETLLFGTWREAGLLR